MFINAESVGKLETPDFKLPVDDFLEPTDIGQDVDGKSLYRGKLGQPLLLNEKLVGNEGMELNIGNGVDTLHGMLCQD